MTAVELHKRVGAKFCIHGGVRTDGGNHLRLLVPILEIWARQMQKSPSKAQLKANCFNFGVSSGDATQILSCLILVLPLVFGRGGYGEKQSSTKG